MFRLGSGALPFLLVLLFQLGFGLSPLAAGLLTFAGGAGALAIKFVAAPIVQRFGFRQTLVGNACLCGLSIIGCAVFRADTPYLVMVGVLFFGGVARSLQMSTLGALTYADVHPHLLCLRRQTRDPWWCGGCGVAGTKSAPLCRSGNVAGARRK